MKCEKKKGWYCELFNSKCDGPNDCCADFIQADDVSDSALMAGSVSATHRNDENSKGYQHDCQRCHGTGCVSTKRYDPPEECDCWDRFQPEEGDKQNATGETEQKRNLH